MIIELPGIENVILTIVSGRMHFTLIHDSKPIINEIIKDLDGYTSFVSMLIKEKTGRAFEFLSTIADKAKDIDVLLGTTNAELNSLLNTKQELEFTLNRWNIKNNIKS